MSTGACRDLLLNQHALTEMANNKKKNIVICPISVFFWTLNPYLEHGGGNISLNGTKDKDILLSTPRW